MVFLLTEHNGAKKIEFGWRKDGEKKRMIVTAVNGLVPQRMTSCTLVMRKYRERKVLTLKSKKRYVLFIACNLK